MPPPLPKNDIGSKDVSESMSKTIAMVRPEEPLSETRATRNTGGKHTRCPSQDRVGRNLMTDGFSVTKMRQVQVRPWNQASKVQIWPQYLPQVCPSGAPQFTIKMVEMGTSEIA